MATAGAPAKQPVNHSCNDGFNAEGVASQSPGLNAAFCVQPWVWDCVELYPKRVEFPRNPFRVGPIIQSLPRVGRKKRGQPWALRTCPFRAVVRRFCEYCVNIEYLNMNMNIVDTHKKPQKNGENLA